MGAAKCSWGAGRETGERELCLRDSNACTNPDLADMAAWALPCAARVEVGVKTVGEYSISELRERLAPTGFYVPVNVNHFSGHDIGAYGDR